MKAEHETETLRRGRAAAIGGAVLAALAASACCVGPLLLAAIGVGGAGALAAFGAYHPYILAATGVLLATGFYLTYRKPKAADACGCVASPKKRAGRVALWIATVLVALLAFSPTLLARLAGNDSASSAEAAAIAATKLETVTLRVEGMDCEACAVSLRRALAKAGGFHALMLDLPGQAVRVSYEPAPGRVEAYVEAINDLGFEASLPGTTAERRHP